jgi:hypothetical protein
LDWFPRGVVLDPSIPEPALSYLTQARETLHAPVAATMCAASAVDSFLKAKGLTDGKLYERIRKARENGTITPEMATWATQVRLDANEPRHADERKPLPTPEEARRTVQFAEALAEFFFVVPSRVSRGVADSKQAATGQA